MFFTCPGDILAQCRGVRQTWVGWTLTKDRSDLKYVVDHFVIDKPNPVSDSSSSFQSNTAFAVLSALSKTTVQGGIILALFAIVAAISFRSSRKPKQHKTETENKEK